MVAPRKAICPPHHHPSAHRTRRARVARGPTVATPSSAA